MTGGFDLFLGAEYLSPATGYGASSIQATSTCASVSLSTSARYAPSQMASLTHCHTQAKFGPRPLPTSAPNHTAVPHMPIHNTLHTPHARVTLPEPCRCINQRCGRRHKHMQYIPCVSLRADEYRYSQILYKCFGLVVNTLSVTSTEFFRLALVHQRKSRVG